MESYHLDYKGNSYGELNNFIIYKIEKNGFRHEIININVIFCGILVIYKSKMRKKILYMYQDSNYSEYKLEYRRNIHKKSIRLKYYYNKNLLIIDTIESDEYKYLNNKKMNINKYKYDLFVRKYIDKIIQPIFIFENLFMYFKKYKMFDKYLIGDIYEYFGRYNYSL